MLQNVSTCRDRGWHLPHMVWSFELFLHLNFKCYLPCIQFITGNTQLIEDSHWMENGPAVITLFKRELVIRSHFVFQLNFYYPLGERSLRWWYSNGTVHLFVRSFMRNNLVTILHWTSFDPILTKVGIQLVYGKV